MKLSLIPAPEKIEYLAGFSKASAEVVKVSDNTIPEEGFVIDIDGKITVRASSDSGFFYAGKALEQIQFQCGQNLQNVHIEDSPEFPYRSFMIDSCRHFFPVKSIKRMIEHCAKLRFNVFHWHLTDDQGWRPEIKGYPELTEVGSIRRENHFGSEQNNNIHAGFYTRVQMEDIVKFAHERHMTVVPEIDMPGHVSALLKSIPYLACGGKQVEIKTKPGIFKDIVCAGSEKSYETLFEILDEICDIFPDEYIHIGGDEAPKIQWKGCPECQKRIADEGLKNEEALQGYFINRIKNYLAGKGKKVITWNESLKSGMLDDDVTVQMWMDPKRLSAKSPNKIINSDFYHRYADYPYAMTPLKKVYNYNLKINGNVIGSDIPIWTEYVSSLKRMEYMCFPRFMAAAQAAWCKNKPIYKQFKTELIELMPYFGVRNAAKPEEWDPPAHSRLTELINHYNENIKNLFEKS